MLVRTLDQAFTSPARVTHADLPYSLTPQWMPKKHAGRNQPAHAVRCERYRL